MAASPRWTVYDRNGTYQAACKEIEAAATLMGLYGHGATIRYHHDTLVWTQGPDGDATESYDHIASIVTARLYDTQQP